MALELPAFQGSAPRLTAWTLLIALILSGLFSPEAQAGVKAYRGKIEIPTYPWRPPIPHPYFRETDGRNIYPYPMMDNLKRQKEPRSYQTVVLENEYLRVTFLPALGGKVHEVINKITGKPVFYVNNVVKPGLIGMCGAWTSGGIEFNTGPTGHTVSAMQPVDVEILPPGPDGSRSVAVGEVERIYRTRWTVVVTLRPGRSFLEERIRIYNRTETVRPYYFWNCTAVPNPPGFRFIYPMTLGTDHGGGTFYTWPISKGRDLSKGTSYRDASSIFAYKCDQDFFGSYDVDADRGVVAHANHHLLPGKKAWTWGQGSYGTMHQMDLTDDDGPYNEVQTGPLRTQADVGRLDPHEAVTWKEWWYPVHGIGGFTFADKNVAVNAERNEKGLRLRMIGTGTWDSMEVKVDRESKTLAGKEFRLSPREPVDLSFQYPRPDQPVQVTISGSGSSRTLRDTVFASFQVPLDLPIRKPPEKRKKTGSAAELAHSGWQEYLFARHAKAESLFKMALEKDPNALDARTGLAFLNLERDPEAAARECRAALEVDPGLGLARYGLAICELKLEDELFPPLQSTWKASLDPATAVPARALAAKILLHLGRWEEGVAALSADGPWQGDPVSRNRLALALNSLLEWKEAIQLARRNLDEDPLDAFARSILWLARKEEKSLELNQLISGKPQGVLELAASYSGLGQFTTAADILKEFYIDKKSSREDHPIPFYWAAYLNSWDEKKEAQVERWLEEARSLPAECVFPHREETVPVLEWALKKDPKDGKAALYLGHLLFSLGRHGEGREHWKLAAGLGAAPAVAYRALGMACQKLDGDLKGAAEYLQKAHRADPSDPIVSRDLARTLFSLAGEEEPEGKRKTYSRISEILSSAFEKGKGRSDFVALLARAQSRLGRYEETARLLDSVRITIWEGAREAHDLFEEAHLALGKAHLEAGRPGEALKEFNRALEYPENLATGRLENTREAHIHFLRGKALQSMGKWDEALAAYRKAAGERASGNKEIEEARKEAREALERGAPRGF